MSSYSINKIKRKRSYSIAEIVSLLGIDRRTCSRWIKDEGLKVIEEHTIPLLVMGVDLEEFIRKKRTERKIPLKKNEFCCFKCHKAVIAKIGSESIVKTGKRIGKENREQFRKIGICEICAGRVTKYLAVSRKD